ncbi:uncharacterized protein LOC120082425 isoform X2 [Benincasa hispida]|uniref:uncharacterized protein LOC120082425 isoform X2 n=1 Tax=Benincasa hispida TaxID=102211 RepID=UPI0019014FE3|nr:uncharacterized protein LOC120082425 isoform X2 [Benincasa hispida]
MSKHQSDTADQDKLGPDTFSYFKREVIDLLSQEDNLPSPPHDSQISGASPPFGDSIGPNLSHFKKEKLKTLLRQSVAILSKEVNEMLDPALSTQCLKSYLRSKKNLENVEKIAMNDVEQASYDELQFFLENNGEQIEDIVTELSNDLSGALGHMEQQLEEILDSVLSNCRPMTLKEREQLQKLVQELPSENLGRVAEIVIQHSTDETDLSDGIHIDLDKENNTTLWRLYYYVKAVEKAKKLASG